MSSRSAAVTGAGGFIGRATCRRLTEAGYDVIGLDISSSDELAKLGVRQQVCDVRDSESLERHFSGAELVIHTAAIVSDWGGMDEFIEINVRGTRNVLDAAEMAGASTVVHVSSVASWGYDTVRPPSDRHWTARQGVPYVDTKAASDDLALRRGATVIRPGDVYGPGSIPWSVRPLQAIASGRFILPGKGEGLMAPVYIDDLVDLIMLAAEAPSATEKAYTGFNGETVSSAEFFGHYARMLGKSKVPTAPRPLATLSLAALELVARITGTPPQASRNAMVFIDRKVGYATSAAQDELGWRPRTSLLKGMRATEDWFRLTGLLPDSLGA